VQKGESRQKALASWPRTSKSFQVREENEETSYGGIIRPNCGAYWKIALRPMPLTNNDAAAIEYRVNGSLLPDMVDQDIQSLLSRILT
jgi:hypothetical protein